MSNYTTLLENLDKLNLVKIRSYLPEYLDTIAKSPPHLIDSLEKLTSLEIENQTFRASENLIKVAAFPFKKTVEDFNFDFQPSLNKDEILDLATLRFIEQNQNVLLVGNSGVGKTHLATALGIKAAEKRYSVYFVNCHDLITRLNKAFKENRLDKQLQHFAQYRLLIIDEIGYIPVDKQGANLFFQLIARRYTKKSTIITTNMPFSKWGEVFNDVILANAVLDRLIDNSHIISINGSSYRIKNTVMQVENSGAKKF